MSPEYGSQGQDHEDLQVRKVSIKEQRHEGGSPRLVSPRNDAIHPRRGGQPEVPEPRRARRRMYGGGHPTTMNNYVKISMFILFILNWMVVVQSTKPTLGQQGPRCFLAVSQRRGWWNTRAKHTSGHKPRIRGDARGVHTKTTGTQIDDTYRRLVLYEQNTKNKPPRNHPSADVPRPAYFWTTEPQRLCQALRPPATLGFLTHLGINAHTRDLTHGPQPKHQTKATKAPPNQQESRSGITIPWTVQNSSITTKFGVRLATINKEHIQSTMKHPHAKTKTHCDNTNTPTCSNTSAPPKITRSGQIIPTLKHDIMNNSQIRQILYKKHSENLSASLRSNKTKHGSDKTHDQSVLAAPTKLTLCRQPKRPEPWTIIIHHGGSAQWQLPCTNQIATARRHPDKTKLSLSSETIMADQFSTLMNNAITSLRNSKKRRGDEETDDESSESNAMETENKQEQDNSVAETGESEGGSQTGIRPSDVPSPQTGEGTKVQLAFGTIESTIVSPSNSQTLAMPDPGQEVILANELGTRARWYSETWDTPMPDPQALAPDTDLTVLRTDITEANIDDVILAKRLRAHKEALAYLEPALMDWDDRLKATATIIRAALATHEEIVHRKAATLETMKLELSTIPPRFHAPLNLKASSNGRALWHWQAPRRVRYCAKELSHCNNG